MSATRRRPPAFRAAIVGALLVLTGCAPASVAQRNDSLSARGAAVSAVPSAAAGSGRAADAPSEAATTRARPRAAATVAGYRSVRSHDSVARPVAVTVPTIGVSSDLARLGRAADGAIEVPADWQQAGWYRKGPKPGQVGPAVILGHVDSRAGPAVFHRLRELRPGDAIHVDRADGTTVTFVVDSVERHAKTRFPSDEVYLPTLRPTLRLVTCGGAFDAASGHYRDNVVVFASLAD